MSPGHVSPSPVGGRFSDLRYAKQHEARMRPSYAALHPTACRMQSNSACPLRGQPYADPLGVGVVVSCVRTLGATTPSVGAPRALRLHRCN
jgi:hypothetical protein